MTMTHGTPLSAHEATQFHAGRLGLLVRPCKTPPQIVSEVDAWWRDGKADLLRNAAQHARDCCPLGEPGEVRFVKEAFVIESFGAGCAQIRYSADGQRGNNAGISDRGLPNRLGKVSAIRATVGSSRGRFRILANAVKRVQEITFDECLAARVTDSPHWNGVMPDELVIPDGLTQDDAINAGWESYVRAVFQKDFDERHGPGAWERNDYCWFQTIERVQDAR